MEKEKVKIIHTERDGDFMEVVERLGKEVKRNSDDIIILKESDKEFKTFVEYFREYIIRDDEQKKVMSKGFDEIKTAVVTLTDSVSDQGKELMRIELSEELRSEREKNNTLRKEIEDSENGLFGKFKNKFIDRLADIGVWIILGGGFLVGLYKVFQPMLESLPK